jgi:hypothetical protein
MSALRFEEKEPAGLAFQGDAVGENRQHARPAKNFPPTRHIHGNVI